MVSYQRWTSIVFDVARSKGADTSTEQTNIIQTAARLWNSNKSQLEAASVAEARRLAQANIRVS